MEPRLLNNNQTRKQTCYGDEMHLSSWLPACRTELQMSKQVAPDSGSDLDAAYLSCKARLYQCSIGTTCPSHPKCVQLDVNAPRDASNVLRWPPELVQLRV
jgi:hypothetical protein